VTDVVTESVANLCWLARATAQCLLCNVIHSSSFLADIECSYAGAYYTQCTDFYVVTKI